MYGEHSWVSFKKFVPKKEKKNLRGHIYEDLPAYMFEVKKKETFECVLFCLREK